MRPFILFFLFLTASLTSVSQADHAGVLAVKDGETKDFLKGAYLNVRSRNGVIISKIKGNLVGVSDTTITLRDRNRIINIKDIESITRLSGGRRITATVMGLGIGLGGVLVVDGIVDANQRKGELLAGAGIILGVALFTITAIPHLIVTSSERKASTSKGYEFKPLIRGVRSSDQQ